MLNYTQQEPYGKIRDVISQFSQAAKAIKYVGQGQAPMEIGAVGAHKGSKKSQKGKGKGSQSPQGSTSTPKSNVKCTYCSKDGHTEAQCYKKKNAQKGKDNGKQGNNGKINEVNADGQPVQQGQLALEDAPY